ncbi:galactokinase [Candidatus Latescibacterota bacterium]
MQHKEKLIDNIHQEKTENLFKTLYGGSQDIISSQTQRYIDLVSSFDSVFPERDSVSFFSTPGRSEIGGNHTDHNAGRVLAAAVNLDIIAAVSENNRNEIVIESDGFENFTVNLSGLSMIESEINTSGALVRGVCARMKELGYEIGGFDAAFMSSVPNGSGLSSSAAFEVLIVTILDHLYNGNIIAPLTRAYIARYAENNYFGKPCGLMDQATCSAGGFVSIDFRDFDNPVVKKIEYDFSSRGYSLAIVNTNGSHADLTDDYAAIKNEMIDVAQALGGDVLREFSKEYILDNIPILRSKISDRAILRALHFYADNQRVVEQVSALEQDNPDEFMRLIIESGNSSWMMCQNCYTAKAVNDQPVSIALAISKSILKGKGAWRVHGGGFAGTIQAFVPNELKEVYFNKMREIFGQDSCYDLSIRPEGSIKLDI